MAHSHAHSFMYCPCLLLHYNDRVEQLQLHGLKIFTNRSLPRKKFVDNLLKDIINLDKDKSIHVVKSHHTLIATVTIG